MTEASRQVGGAAAPVAFVSHGAPSLVLEHSDPTHAFLSGFGRTLGAPRAILCVSAHWDTPTPALTMAVDPATIHDFHGFPPALYALRYPAPGAPWLALRARELLAAAGIDAHLDTRRGLDHGAWAPLYLMFPEAAVPVVQLSVQSGATGAHHLGVGRALAPLAAEGVLVLGSGGATHPLGEALRADPAQPLPGWVREFDGWLERAVTAGDFASLADWPHAPQAPRNHPTPEHFLPLLVAAGAAGDAGRVAHRGASWGLLSMAAFRWGAAGG